MPDTGHRDMDRYGQPVPHAVTFLLWLEGLLGLETVMCSYFFTLNWRKWLCWPPGPFVLMPCLHHALFISYPAEGLGLPFTGFDIDLIGY